MNSDIPEICMPMIVAAIINGNLPPNFRFRLKQKQCDSRLLPQHTTCTNAEEAKAKAKANSEMHSSIMKCLKPKVQQNDGDVSQFTLNKIEKAAPLIPAKKKPLLIELERLGSIMQEFHSDSSKLTKIVEALESINHFKTKTTPASSSEECCYHVDLEILSYDEYEFLTKFCNDLKISEANYKH